MKTMGRLGVIAAFLLLAAVTSAEQIVTVTDVVDYTDNLWDEDIGVWFLVPKEFSDDPCNWYEDHYPYHRGATEDWGWMHDVSTRVPFDASGIVSATLTILAWDVDSDEGEDDVILVNNQLLGLLTGVQRDWEAVTFTLPTAVLDELWREKKLSVFMDIDQILELTIGYRLTLKSSTLTIQYMTSGTAPTMVPVYRFWSPLTSSHFYTINEAERSSLIDNYPEAWIYEGVAYQTQPTAGSTGARPVYRFWSPLASGHFYTINEAEKQSIINTYPSSVWTYEDVAFYAFAPGEQPAGALPVYRFWSPLVSHHFYTIDEAEKQLVIDTYPLEVWTYEGIAWYAFPR